MVITSTRAVTTFWRRRASIRETGPAAPGHPYTGTIGEGVGKLWHAPLLGPVNDDDPDPDTEMWGLDFAYRLDSSAGMTVISPHETGALMGYCWTGTPQNAWTSVYEWNLLVRAIRDGYRQIQWFQPTEESTTGNHMLVSGKIAADDSGVLQASFRPVSRLAGELSVPQPGDYTLRAWDGSTLVDEIPFAGLSSNIGADAGVSNGPSAESFMIPVPADGVRFSAFDIVRDGVVIGRIDASDHTPVVRRVSVDPVVVDAERFLDIAWNATDADGDALHATVTFNPGDGSASSPISLAVSGTRIRVPESRLGAADQATVKVEVSDGMLVSEPVFSRPFSVADVAPEILSLEGLGDDALASGGNAVWASVVAKDTEDGRLTGDSIVWRSQLDGVIGTGNDLVFDATNLTEGLHLVSATVTDSAGNVTVGTGLLRVRHAAEYVEAPPIAPADRLGLLSEALAGMDLHPGTLKPLKNAIADVQKELDRDRLDHASMQLERFLRLVDSRDGSKNGLTPADAALLRSYGGDLLATFSA